MDIQEYLKHILWLNPNDNYSYQIYAEAQEMPQTRTWVSTTIIIGP